jgi:hypothetical protein
MIDNCQQRLPGSAGVVESAALHRLYVEVQLELSAVVS